MMRAFAAALLVASTCGLVSSEIDNINGQHAGGQTSSINIGEPTTAPITATADYILPETAIVGPTKPVKYGKVISLRIKLLDKLPDNLQSVIYVWRVNPPADDLVIFSNNSQIVFGSGVEDATYNVQVIASYLYGKRSGTTWTDVANKMGTAEQTVLVRGTPVPPGPTPIPPGPTPIPPGPTPPVPDGKYKLAQSAMTWLGTVSLDAATKKADIAALAAAFTATANKISASIAAAAAGTDPEIHNAAEALAAAKVANGGAVGAHRTSWMPWFVSLDAKLRELQLGTTKGSELQELVDGFSEIATGLAAASLGG